MSESKQRKVHTAEFKAKVGLEAIRGVKSINDIGQEFGVHPVMDLDDLLVVMQLQRGQFGRVNWFFQFSFSLIVISNIPAPSAASNFPIVVCARRSTPLLPGAYSPQASSFFSYISC